MTEVKAGYLHKCGGKVKSWKKRWVILRTNGFLIYYEKKGGAEKGSVDLINSGRTGLAKDIDSSESIPSGVDGAKAFSIVTKERTYTLYAETPAECNDWIANLMKVKSCNDDTQYQGYPAPTNPTQPAQLALQQVQTQTQQAPPLPAKDSPPAYTPYPVGGGLPPRSASMPQQSSYRGPPPAMPQQPPYGGPPPAMPQQPPYGGPPPAMPQPQQSMYRGPLMPQPYGGPPPTQAYRPPPQPQAYRPPPQPGYQQPYYPTKPAGQAYYQAPPVYKQPMPPRPVYRAPPPHRPLQQQQSNNTVVVAGGMVISINNSQQQGGVGGQQSSSNVVVKR